MECWAKFRRIVEQRIWEANAVAGERLWEIEAAEKPALGFRVYAAGRPAQSVECTLDSGRGLVSCRLGEAIRGRRREFVLRKPTRQALDDVLDLLAALEPG